MAQIEITQAYCTYQCQTVLVNLASQIALSRSKTKPAIKSSIQLGTQIRLGLEALNYSAFLMKDQIDEILYLLAHIATINAIPYAPVVTSIAPPTILVGIPGRQGNDGNTGATGGGTAFSATNISVDTVVDSFPITLSGAAEWTYDVSDATNKRVERLIGCWLSDGSAFADDGGITLDPEIGSTSGSISFYTNINAGVVELIAQVTAGTWNISGSRVLIPVTGNGITQPTSLTNGAIWIGDSSNQPQSQILSGDVTVSNAGVTVIGAGVIVNADINTTAAIAVSKFAPLTASKAVVSDSSGFLTTSTTSAIQVGYLSGVTSDVQAQIDAIAMSGTITGAITPFVTTNAAPSLAIVSNPSGKLTVSGTTSAQIGYLSTLAASSDISNIVGTTSSVQTQITGKVSKTGDSMSGALVSSSTGEFDGGVRTQSSGPYLLKKVVPIGAWDMDTAPIVNVAHGLSSIIKIRTVSVTILDDLTTLSDSLFRGVSTANTAPQGFEKRDSTNIILTRLTSGVFDSLSYSSIIVNRGYITIEYEA